MLVNNALVMLSKCAANYDVALKNSIEPRDRDVHGSFMLFFRYVERGDGAPEMLRAVVRTEGTPKNKIC